MEAGETSVLGGPSGKDFLPADPDWRPRPASSMTLNSLICLSFFIRACPLGVLQKCPMSKPSLLPAYYHGGSRPATPLPLLRRRVWGHLGWTVPQSQALVGIAFAKTAVNKMIFISKRKIIFSINLSIFVGLASGKRKGSCPR